MINRSEVVGRPLAALLANDGAEVYSVDVTGVQQFSRGTGLKKQKHEVRDIEGWSLEQCLPISEVVISGVPGEDFKVSTNLLKEGAVCINFSSAKVRLNCIDTYQHKLMCSELRSRCEGEGFNLRTSHWQGDDSHPSAKPAANHAEPTAGEWRAG